MITAITFLLALIAATIAWATAAAFMLALIVVMLALYEAATTTPPPWQAGDHGTPHRPSAGPKPS